MIEDPSRRPQPTGHTTSASSNPLGSTLMTPPPPPTPKDNIAKLLDECLGIVHVVGSRILGRLWITLFESLQDTLALGLLIKIPNLLSLLVIGKEFSGLDTCWNSNNWWSVERYACFTVVISNYTIWAVLIPRILYRCWRDMLSPRSNGQGGGYE